MFNRQPKNLQNDLSVKLQAALYGIYCVINFTTTQSMGWVGQSEQWAQVCQQFEVHKVEVQHFRFCHRFCVLHSYHCEFQSHALGLAAIFTPPESRTVESILS